VQFALLQFHSVFPLIWLESFFSKFRARSVPEPLELLFPFETAWLPLPTYILGTNLMLMWWSIFIYFRQFCAKQLSIFSKTNVMFSCSCIRSCTMAVKVDSFHPNFFGDNMYLQNHNSFPCVRHHLPMYVCTYVGRYVQIK
jgi:hypothetical protein